MDFKLNTISYTDKLSGFKNMEFVIEAIVEDEEIKKMRNKKINKG